MQKIATQITFKILEATFIGVTSRILVNAVCDDLGKKSKKQMKKMKRSTTRYD